MKLRGYDPRLHVSPSRCPDPVVIAAGLPGACTIDIDGTSIPVQVAYAGPPATYHVQMPGYFYERRVIENLVAANADDQLGGRHRAHCGLPAYSVMPSGKAFICEILGGPSPISVTMRTGDNGVVDFGDLPGRTAAPTALDKKISAEHSAGKTTIVPGRIVAAMIDRVLGDIMRSAPWKPSGIGHARCPPQLDLTGDRHGLCYVPVGTQQMREEITIQGAGYHMEPLDAVMDMRRVESTQEQVINGNLASRGMSQRVRIACPGTYLVVAAPGDFYCDMLVGTQRAKLQVHVLDARGDMQARVATGSPPATH